MLRNMHFVARSGSKCIQKAENRGSCPSIYSVIAKMYEFTVQFVIENRQKYMYYEYSLRK